MMDEEPVDQDKARRSPDGCYTAAEWQRMKEGLERLAKGGKSLAYASEMDATTALWRNGVKCDPGAVKEVMRVYGFALTPPALAGGGVRGGG